MYPIELSLLREPCSNPTLRASNVFAKGRETEGENKRRIC